MDQTVRQLVRERAGHRCEYCRIPQFALPWARFHVEHIRASQHGGTDHLENLALACRNCNLYKGPNLSAVDPITGQIVLLFNPRTDQWNGHFVMSDDFQIMGTTDVGRATASLLNMNHSDRVQLRAEIAELGEVV
jgi:hypothetical protein